jgi:hypothetical protein
VHGTCLHPAEDICFHGCPYGATRPDLLRVGDDQVQSDVAQTEPPPHANGVSSWVPTVDRVELALLGKLLEETAELGKIAARCIMQGLGDRDPETGRLNCLVLSDELSDMQARIKSVEHVLSIGPEPQRVEAKYNFHLSWLRDLKRRFGSRWTP